MITWTILSSRLRLKNWKMRSTRWFTPFTAWRPTKSPLCKGIAKQIDEILAIRAGWQVPFLVLGQKFSVAKTKSVLICAICGYFCAFESLWPNKSSVNPWNPCLIIFYLCVLRGNWMKTVPIRVNLCHPCLFFSVTSVAKKSVSDRPQNRNSRQTKKSVLPRPEHGQMDSWLYFSVFSVASPSSAVRCPFREGADRPVAKKGQCKSVSIFSILTKALFKGRFSGLP